MIWFIILASIGIPLALVVWRVDDWNRDWTTNHASLEDTAVRPELRPQIFTGAVADVADRIERWSEQQSHWDLVQRNDTEWETTLKMTRTTGLFRFVDDVTVQLRSAPESEGHVTMYATSQSRIGKGDLGQNPRNLAELVRGVNAM
ncbi:hypothetical protein Pla52n_59520 [Stieleria varia]|uniref:DUF1499 domain-containing protein n=2 Tax=Stieleria varia TaxID=2528005 RepID=A0A5C6A0E1_9BACT|nr:hypothetical protein Pla52n_59520 [Stieleria varia]